jgi:5'-3' exonuclease
MVLVNAGKETAEGFLADLRTHYIKGLMWCLAYYIKGWKSNLCI